MTVGTNVSVNNVNASAANVTVLPNPNNGTFTIKGNIGSTADEAVDIQITDMLGQVIYREKAKAVKGELAHPVSLSGSLANGMYMISVKSEHINGTLHFILGH
jgi:hypothetical protein